MQAAESGFVDEQSPLYQGYLLDNDHVHNDQPPQRSVVQQRERSLFQEQILQGDYPPDRAQTIETLQSLLREAQELWQPPEHLDDYLPWLNQQFDLDPNQHYHSDKIIDKYKDKMADAVRLYYSFEKENLVGEYSEDTVTNSDIFGRLTESIAYHFDALYSMRKAYSTMDPNREFGVSPFIAMFKYRWLKDIEANSFQRFVLYLLRWLHDRKYRKYKESCYKEIITEEGHHTHAWEEVCTIKEVVYKSIEMKHINIDQWLNATESASNFRRAIEYLTEAPDLEFPFLQPDRKVFSFRNGIYFADVGGQNVDHFINYNDPEKRIPLDVVACKYFDLDFPEEYMDEDINFYDIPTPYFQSILDTQKIEKEVCRWIYVFFGRLLYEVGEKDHWEVLLFIKGLAGSGKSTMGKVAREFYNAEDVGTLSADMEAKFGLSALYEKLLFVCYEVKKKFALPQAKIQSMISGEPVEIAIKHKTAETTKTWTTPGIMMGNEVADWIDSQGSMVRRLILLEFLVFVQEKDKKPDLFQCLKKEIPYILLKCNAAYLSAVEEYGHKSIWEEGVLPDYFQKTRNRLEVQINPLVALLSDSQIIEFGEDRYITLNELQVKLNEYNRTYNYRMGRMSKSDYENTIERLGLTMAQEKRFWDDKEVTAIFISGIGLAQNPLDRPHCYRDNDYDRIVVDEPDVPTQFQTMSIQNNDLQSNVDELDDFTVIN